MSMMHPYNDVCSCKEERRGLRGPVLRDRQGNKLIVKEATLRSAHTMNTLVLKKKENYTHGVCFLSYAFTNAGSL